MKTAVNRPALFAATLILTIAGNLPAATIAYTNAGANPSGSVDSINIGRTFTVSNTGIIIQQLGVYDSEGIAGLVNPHDVTLFNSSHTAIATVNVPSGTSATLIDGFRFEPIAPIALSPGTYSVVAYGLDTGVNGVGDHYGDGGGVLSSPNAHNLGDDPYQFDGGASPNFPNGGVGDGNDHSGASFLFTPEPSSFVLCGLGAIGLLCAARRRKA